MAPGMIHFTRGPFLCCVPPGTLYTRKPMIDTSEIRRRMSDPDTVAGLLGLKRRNGKIRCPVHRESNPSCTLNNVGGAVVFFCHSCKAQGDVFALVGAVHGVDFQEAGRIAGELVNVGTTDHAPRAYVAPPEAPPVYPDELARDVLRRSSPVPEGTLDHRNGGRPLHLDPWAARWLHAGGPQFAESWFRTGHWLLIPMFDTCGEFRTLIARRVDAFSDDLPKSLTARGFSCKNVAPMNAAFRNMIRDPWVLPCTVLMVEGEIDFLIACSKFPETPILCVRSGTLSDRERWRLTIPEGSTIIGATDLDPAGDKYDELIRSTWAGKDITFKRFEDPLG